ncbi:MAG: ATP-dependent RNA helicase RhlE [Elusimicrobia bacterium ADurb.Bin231]|nr:MAG: ATP-dependent RNA helicase RhlE [Elusimicrobia bacterium ADurb.Bin231]
MNTNSHDSFYGLGIAPGLLQVLTKLGFDKPTPIQYKAIPHAVEGKDIIGIAQTGTGKTLAYGIPMIQRLAQKKGRGLVLVPTRELAIQVNDAIKKFAHASAMETAVLIGGESSLRQIEALKKNPRIIVATPGRLNDLIGQRQARVSDVNVLVLDEADRMLDMGFKPQIEKIIHLIPVDRQTMLFSATMPNTIVSMASKHMKLPIRTEIAPEGTAAEGISQEIFVVSSYLKAKLLGELLNKYTGPVLLFTRTKRGATTVARIIRGMGHKAAEIHADRSLGQRKEALSGFKSGKYRILVATDIAARGIDVIGIEVVINYDLPDDPENYVHRIGRTGRAGQIGHAISFATPGQGADVKNIEKIIRVSIPLSKHPTIPTEEFCSSSRKSSFSHQVDNNYHGSRSRYHVKRRKFH